MKIVKSIFVSLMLCVVVKGNMLGAAVRGIEPFILSFGTALAAYGLDSKNTHDVNHFDWDKVKDFFKEVYKDLSLGVENYNKDFKRQK